MGSRLADNIVWAEMARRKVRFHKTEKWNEIKLWGLFQWGAISHLLKTGDLITDMRKENRTVWVWPSPDAWRDKIKPLIEKKTLSQLTQLAGWKF